MHPLYGRRDFLRKPIPVVSGRIHPRRAIYLAKWLTLTKQQRLRPLCTEIRCVNPFHAVLMPGGNRLSPLPRGPTARSAIPCSPKVEEALELLEGCTSLEEARRLCGRAGDSRVVADALRRAAELTFLERLLR